MKGITETIKWMHQNNLNERKIKINNFAVLITVIEQSQLVCRRNVKINYSFGEVIFGSFLVLNFTL